MNRKTAVAGIVLSSLLEMLCERRSHSLPLLLGHARVVPVRHGRGAESDVAARPDRRVGPYERAGPVVATADRAGQLQRGDGDHTEPGGPDLDWATVQLVVVHGRSDNAGGPPAAGAQPVDHVAQSPRRAAGHGPCWGWEAGVAAAPLVHGVGGDRRQGGDLCGADGDVGADSHHSSSKLNQRLALSPTVAVVTTAASAVAEAGAVAARGAPAGPLGAGVGPARGRGVALPVPVSVGHVLAVDHELLADTGDDPLVGAAVTLGDGHRQIVLHGSL